MDIKIPTKNFYHTFDCKKCSVPRKHRVTLDIYFLFKENDDSKTPMVTYGATCIICNKRFAELAKISDWNEWLVKEEGIVIKSIDLSSPCAE